MTVSAEPSAMNMPSGSSARSRGCPPKNARRDAGQRAAALPLGPPGVRSGIGGLIRVSGWILCTIDPQNHPRARIDPGKVKIIVLVSDFAVLMGSMGLVMHVAERR